MDMAKGRELSGITGYSRAFYKTEFLMGVR